ncbi:MAG: hypothetical protein O2871_00940 [bacterium]|nr:hypothetical protein [bacterium]
MTEMPTTQDHLDIASIKDDIVILKNGGASMVIKTTAVNFDLLSEREQDAMIAAYGNLLNSLSFQTQVVIRSKRMDITEYLEWVDTKMEEQRNKKLKELTQKYKLFIKDLITKNDVLDKKFYVVLTYGQISLVGRNSPLSSFKQLFGVHEKRIHVDIDSILDKAKTNLYPKRDSLIKEFKRVGIKASQLSSKELLQLYYDIYNTETSRNQRIKLNSSDYTTPLVEPLILENKN